MRTLRVRTFPGPFHQEWEDITAVRIQTCLDIAEEAAALVNVFDTLPKGKFDHINYIEQMRLGKEWRPSWSGGMHEYAIRLSRERMPVIRFGDLHVFGLDRDGNFYHKRFCRDNTYSYDLRIWWPLGDLRTCYFQVDVLQGYLLSGLRARRAELVQQ